MSPIQILLGFLPWIVFAVVADAAGPDAVGIAAMLAFVTAAALVVRSVVRGSSAKLLEVAGAAAFALVALWALVSPASDGFLVVYGSGLVTLVLAAVILATLPVRGFTEQYARESVPREYWTTPRFRSVNRRTSAVWGGAIGGIAVADLVADRLGAQGAGHSPAALLLDWAVPALLLVAAVRYTRRAADGAGRAATDLTGVR